MIDNSVVRFQHLERCLTDLIVTIAKADDGIIRILIAELSFSSRIKATDVAFARTVELVHAPNQESKENFHALMVRCQKLGERRNDLMHSGYVELIENGEIVALVRENPKLRGREGILKAEGEGLSPEAFECYFTEIDNVLEELEQFRLIVIDWQ